MLPILIPIISELVKNGLELVGNAVLAKGKDYIEEKTGVTLGENMPPEDLLKLKQFQLENELELAKLRQADNRLELEFYQAETSDTDSARKRDMAFTAAGAHNYRADVMFAIAVVTVVALTIMIWSSESLDDYVKGIFTLVLGRFLGYIDNAYQFEFGRTRSSASKDASIENLTKGSK
jgi:hypothetical protein